jgi:hypothetical protein
MQLGVRGCVEVSRLFERVVLLDGADRARAAQHALEQEEVVRHVLAQQVERQQRMA